MFGKFNVICKKNKCQRGSFSMLRNYSKYHLYFLSFTQYPAYSKRKQKKSSAKTLPFILSEKVGLEV